MLLKSLKIPIGLEGSDSWGRDNCGAALKSNVNALRGEWLVFVLGM